VCIPPIQNQLIFKYDPAYGIFALAGKNGYFLLPVERGALPPGIGPG
jgi:hypothetical protein